tara:strand:- start:2556 stop:3299 length:744 start_codon:yes stop_codon:yes gene_type:complete
MHVCFLDHWDIIVHDLFEMLEEFDVYTRVYEIRICSVGNKTNLSHNIWNRHSKIRLYAHDENIHLYEKFTLDILRNDALLASENFNVFYLHSKGITKYNNEYEHIKTWNKYMIVSCWESSLTNELQKCNAIGCRLSKLNIGPHFSGNFWWSKSDYLKTLKLVGSNYYDAESWILSSEGLIYNRNTKNYVVDKEVFKIGVKHNTCYVFIVHIFSSIYDYIVVYNSNVLSKKIEYFRKICLKRLGKIHN